MIKKALLGFLFAFSLPVLAFGGDISVSSFGGGLNTQDSAAAIQPDQAQDLLNVNAIPGGAGVFKRDGYAAFKTVNSASGAVVHGGYHFQKTNGSDVQLWGSGVNLVSIVDDGTPTNIITTATSSPTWQCTDSQGQAYCFNSNNDAAVKTDGTSAGTSAPAGIPAGTMGVMTPTRLLVAGVAANLSTIYYSAQNSFSDFTAGVLPSSAGTEIIAAPGSRITHLAYYFGKWFWWKDSSFGYVTGDDQFSLAVTIVSSTVGTLDNSDAFWNAGAYSNEVQGAPSTSQAGSIYGGIYFRGQDNHFYLYDGYSLTRLSRTITPTVTSANRQKANAWSQSSASDFNGGRYSSTTYSSTNSGVVISTDDVNPTDYSFESTNWASTSGSGWAMQTGTQTNFFCSLAPKDGTHVAIYTSTTSASYNVTFSLLDANTNASYGSVTVNNSNGNSCIWAQRQIPVSSPPAVKTPVYISMNAYGVNNLNSPAFAYSGNANITFYTYFDATVASAGTKYMTFADYFNSGKTDLTTGIYYSTVHNATGITSWGNFIATTSGTGGTHSYFVRSSTNTFSILSSTPVWVSQSNNGIVASSTGTYFQMSDTFTVTSASFTPTLTSFSFNWYEGSATDKAYITYFNDAIWFSVSSGTASTNNRIFYWDLLNQGWFIYDIAANGFLTENNSLYLGSPATGAVYKFGSVTTDAGSSINSYWTSKDFLGTDPFVQNEYLQSDFIVAEASPTVATYTYTLNTSSSTSVSIQLSDPLNLIVKRGFLLPRGKIGTFYRFTFGDNSGNPKWSLLAHKVHYNALNWIPQTQ